MPHPDKLSISPFLKQLYSPPLQNAFSQIAVCDRTNLSLRPSFHANCAVFRHRRSLFSVAAVDVVRVPNDNFQSVPFIFRTPQKPKLTAIEDRGTRTALFRSGVYRDRPQLDRLTRNMSSDRSCRRGISYQNESEVLTELADLRWNPPGR